MGHCEDLKSPYLAFYYNMLDTLDSGLKNYSPKQRTLKEQDLHIWTEEIGFYVSVAK